MTVRELKLRDFTVFENTDFEFVSGINVIIGENATGKTHVLKALYSLLTTCDMRREPAGDLREALAAIFMPDEKNVSRLVRSGAEGPAHLWTVTDHGETHGSFNGEGDVEVTVFNWPQMPQPLYLPARDVLAMYEGFIPLYERASISFDKTYYDVCVALQSPGQRGDAKEKADALVAPISAILGGAVELRGPRFYVDAGDGPREAHLMAEGLRKIASLAHLVGNGSIAKGGTLLWDEPETNLNPRLVAQVATALRHLAAGGVQVIITTHDFLLSHRLSLAAEFQQSPGVETRFFSLSRERAGYPVDIQWSANVAGLQTNPILDAFTQYYNDQRELFRQELQRDLEGEP